jgi:hypothetical protein
MGFKSNGLGRPTARGRTRHWRTVGLDIPCQVASQQSLTPFLQAAKAYAANESFATTIGHRSYASKIQTPGLIWCVT